MSDREQPARLVGYLAEFEDVDSLYQACIRMRDEGFRNWDAHTPFPVHGLDDAVGIKNSKLPLLVLIGGISGAGLGLLLQWWTNAVNYPLNISGKPLFSIPANIPVTFETTVLLGALSAFFGMLIFNRLPQYYHPVFQSERFRRATADRFFISVEAADAKFDRVMTRDFLESLGSSAIESLEED